ncbi:MAG: hypothetical protein J3Q66DRAFT_382823 [Benniella sp.]|nr:MAG: hypothetical protein J3Q66DRAFT_382823 [Benniella sp.]
MECTNNDRTGLCRCTSRPAIAMGFPKILSNVLSFLDRPALRVCCQVSRLWYNCSQKILWHVQEIALPCFVGLVCDLYETYNHSNRDIRTYVHENNFLQKMRHSFSRHCHHLRSLVIVPADSTSAWAVTSFAMNSLAVNAPELKNLRHLAIRWSSLHPMGYDRNATRLLYHLIGGILAQNPGIQEFEWGTGVPVLREFVDLVLRRTSRCLKKLTILGNVGHVRSDVLLYLIEANMKRQQRIQKGMLQGLQPHPGQGQLAADRTALQQPQSRPIIGGIDNESEEDDGCCQLEELVLKDANSCRHHYDFKGFDLTWLLLYTGELPIRSLSLINYETDRFRAVIPTLDPRVFPHENGSLLAILYKCPQLEKLCISFGPINPSSPFNFGLMEHPHFKLSPEAEGLITERDDFVEWMYSYCPHLREIEFGMFYQFTTRHWTNMMLRYGPQLESLSIWGNMASFSPQAFFRVIGPCIPPCPRGRAALRQLTRLNISGLARLNDCAWIALYRLPHLKEFRARQVHMKTTDLIRYEGWICKDLEILEISIAVPLDPTAEQSMWHWCMSRCQWTNEGLCCENRCLQKDPNSSGQCQGGGEGVHDKQPSNKRRWNQTDQDILEGPQKRARTDTTSGNRARESGFPKRVWTSTYFCKRQQVMVCAALGRLTRLRELTIEGPPETCRTFRMLELTLETGLDRLAPLQRNLEKLTVTHLAENLSGQREIEWIARHWVHHNNHRWLEQHPSVYLESFSATTSSSAHSTRVLPSDHQDLLTLNPKFKELIGISKSHVVGGTVYDSTMNLNWLQEQCPMLKIQAASE